MGELMRLRCDSVDAYVSLFSTCAHQPTISWTASLTDGASNGQAVSETMSEQRASHSRLRCTFAECL